MTDADIPELDENGRRAWKAALGLLMGPGGQKKALIEMQTLLSKAPNIPKSDPIKPIRNDPQKFISSQKGELSLFVNGKRDNLRRWFLGTKNQPYDRIDVFARAICVDKDRLWRELHAAAGHSERKIPWHEAFPGARLEETWIDPPVKLDPPFREEGKPIAITRLEGNTLLRLREIVIQRLRDRLEAARRRRSGQPEPLRVHIEGPDGSGAATLTLRLAETLHPLTPEDLGLGDERQGEQESQPPRILAYSGGQLQLDRGAGPTAIEITASEPVEKTAGEKTAATADQHVRLQPWGRKELKRLAGRLSGLEGVAESRRPRLEALAESEADTEDPGPALRSDDELEIGLAREAITLLAALADDPDAALDEPATISRALAARDWSEVTRTPGCTSLAKLDLEDAGQLFAAIYSVPCDHLGRRSKPAVIEAVHPVLAGRDPKTRPGLESLLDEIRKTKSRKADKALRDKLAAALAEADAEIVFNSLELAGLFNLTDDGKTLTVARPESILRLAALGFAATNRSPWPTDQPERLLDAKAELLAREVALAGFATRTALESLAAADRLVGPEACRVALRFVATAGPPEPSDLDLFEPLWRRAIQVTHFIETHKGSDQPDPYQLQLDLVKVSHSARHLLPQLAPEDLLGSPKPPQANPESPEDEHDDLSRAAESLLRFAPMQAGAWLARHREERLRLTEHFHQRFVDRETVGRSLTQVLDSDEPEKVKKAAAKALLHDLTGGRPPSTVPTTERSPERNPIRRLEVALKARAEKQCSASELEATLAVAMSGAAAAHGSMDRRQALIASGLRQLKPKAARRLLGYALKEPPGDQRKHSKLLATALKTLRIFPPGPAETISWAEEVGELEILEAFAMEHQKLLEFTAPEDPELPELTRLKIGEWERSIDTACAAAAALARLGEPELPVKIATDHEVDRLFLAQHEATASGGTEAPMRRKRFELLETLVRSPEVDTTTKQSLLRSLWHDDGTSEIDERSGLPLNPRAAMLPQPQPPTFSWFGSESERNQLLRRLLADDKTLEHFIAIADTGRLKRQLLDHLTAPLTERTPGFLTRTRIRTRSATAALKALPVEDVAFTLSHTILDDDLVPLARKVLKTTSSQLNAARLIYALIEADPRNKVAIRALSDLIKGTRKPPAGKAKPRRPKKPQEPEEDHGDPRSIWLEFDGQAVVLGALTLVSLDNPAKASKLAEEAWEVHLDALKNPEYREGPEARQQRETRLLNLLQPAARRRALGRAGLPTTGKLLDPKALCFAGPALKAWAELAGDETLVAGFDLLSHESGSSDPKRKKQAPEPENRAPKQKTARFSPTATGVDSARRLKLARLRVQRSPEPLTSSGLWALRELFELAPAELEATLKAMNEDERSSALEGLQDTLRSAFKSSLLARRLLEES